MGYRSYPMPTPLLIGYDPVRDLPPDHLARLVEYVVEETVRPAGRAAGPGQPAYDPRLLLKVLVYGYATGVRSSRQLERACRENLPYLYLTRGAAPSYHTLCTARTQEGDALTAVWEGLFAVAAAAGIERLGRIVVDSTKLRADASGDAVLEQREFAAVRAELERILAEVAQVDQREAAEPPVGRTELGQTLPREQMRDILRRVRRQRRPPPGGAGGGGETPGGGSATATAPQRDRGGQSETLPLEEAPALPAPLDPTPVAAEMTPRMLQRVAAGLKAIQEAEAAGWKHLCLTDPEARMMYGGRSRSTRECYSFEVAVDQGLLVAGGTTQENHDNTRLVPLVTAAERHEPHGVQAVMGDCGYYAGDAIAGLLERGLEVCVPDPNTACDLHRGRRLGTTRGQSQGSVPFTYDAAANVYRCPEGNTLRPTQRRQEAGQWRTVYQAERSCQGCPQAAACLRDPAAARRTLRVGDYQELLLTWLARFAEPKFRKGYRHRGAAVEGVFGFLRAALGYQRWSLRGAGKVACEGQLFQLAYQFRKIHRAWAAA